MGVSVSEGRKGGYYALEMAIKRGVGAGWVFQHHTGGAQKLVADMLQNLMDRNLGPAIGKALITLLVARKKEILDAGMNEKEWYDIWEEPLSDYLKNEELRQRVVTYILPGVLKPSAECFRTFTQSLGLSKDNTITDEGLDLSPLLSCLKVGKELGFVGEIGRMLCFHFDVTS